MFDSTHSNSFDWRDIAADPWGDTGPTDSRGRLWLGGALFVVLLGVVFCRLVWLHYWQADEFRRIAAQPIERELPLPGIRGRILARDGSVLAVDEQLASLAVRYRWLEDPPNPAWLRQQARTRLTGAARRDPQRLKAAERDVLAERAEMHVRLAKLCEISLPEWTQRTRRIQQRVEAISRRVNERRLVKAALAAEQQRAERAQDSSSTAQLTWRERLLGDLSEALWPEQQPALPPPIVVAEELDAHVVAAELSLEAVAQIGAHSDDFPGVEIVPQWRRRYPAAALASHVLGHLGAPEKGTATANSEQLPARVGRMGIEHYYERQLRGQPGVKVEVMHRDGALVSTRRQREPTVGRDLVLSLDLALQRTAEALLDSACQRRDALSAADRPSAGGAAIVLDVHSGAVLAAASEPRFDPNLFSAATGDNTSEVAALLADPAHPLFDRTSRMALPPGSVFKPLTAIAILSHGASPQTAVSCQGYLARPDAMRCAIFTRLGHGHGEVDLFAAMAQSCNVYFFHAAAELGPAPLCDWARRLGFGRPTGIDLASEAAGHLPEPQAAGQRWQPRDTQSLAIGQSSLAATPLQIARFMAAVANGGLLVTPHLAERFGVATDVGPSELDLPQLADDLPLAPAQSIPRLDPQLLATVRATLREVVDSEQGTAHATVRLDDLPIAGKTGTAQAGGDRADHAWFAGYCPADAPKVALVVVLEHGGDGGSVAGPVARRLAERMQQLGYFKGRSSLRP